MWMALEDGVIPCLVAWPTAASAGLTQQSAE